MVVSDIIRPRLVTVTIPREGYSCPQICLNGHVLSGDTACKSQKSARFCPKCGSAVIHDCQSCRAPLRGNYRTSRYVAPCTPQNYCYSCGAAYPWTIVRIQTAKEHVAESEGLDDVDRKQLDGVIDDLVAGGPRTELAASQFGRLMKKASQTVGSSLYKIIVDVASEAAKRAITNL